MTEPKPRGRLEVIAGSMFSGKTERLIARLRSARAAGQRVIAFKHRMDDRYDPEHLITHTQDRFDAVRIGSAGAIPAAAAGRDVVGIDEGHFFGLALIDAVQGMKADGQRVIVVGLQFDAWGRPFSPLTELMDMADEALHMYAACRICGGQARYSQRMVPVTTNTLVGGADLYEPRCAQCFEPLPGEPPEQV
jgi:thymidine kinase